MFGILIALAIGVACGGLSDWYGYRYWVDESILKSKKEVRNVLLTSRKDGKVWEVVEIKNKR